MAWQNSTSQTAFYNTIFGPGSGGVYTLFLNYLQPSKLYSFTLQAYPPSSVGGYVGSIQSGSFTTGTDQVAQFIGAVKDTSGTPAPAGVYLQLGCADPPPLGDEYADTFAVTDSQGYYSFSELPGYSFGSWGADICSAGPFTLGVLNSPQRYTAEVGGWGVPETSLQWAMHWNETVVTYSPQVVNFVLNQVFLAAPSSPVVNVAEFSHTALASIAECSQTSTTAEFEATSSASGSFYGFSYSVSSSTSYSNSIGSGQCVNDQGEPGFEIWGEPYVSGSILFNAVDGRTVSIPYEQYGSVIFNNGSAGSGNLTNAPLQDWLSEPTSLSQPDVCWMHGVGFFHFPIAAHSAPQPYFMTAAGSVSSTSGMHWGVSESIDLPGGSSAEATYSAGYALTTTTSNSFQVGVVFATSPVPHTYTVACDGGDASAGTGISVHVWQDS